MLDILRKRKRSWVVILFLGIIVLVFVLFYGGQKFREPGTEQLAEVNGESITQREFGIAYQRVLDEYRRLFKGELSPELLAKAKSTVMEELIQRRLLLQETRRLGLRVTDEELVSGIARIPGFQVEGRFSKNRYLQLLKANRLDPIQFEEEQREQLLIQKLNEILQDSVHVSENEVRERYGFAQERIAFSFIRLSAADFLSQSNVTDAEIKSYYDRNKAALTEPLKVQVEYVVYPFELFSGKVQPTEKEIADYYNLHRETQFHQQKAFKLRHILLRLPPGGNDGQKAAARSKAEAAAKEVRAGKNFSDLAKQYSEEPGGAAKGGDLGWVNQGQLIEPLDQAVFALKKGEVSPVLESASGYHIFKVEDVRNERQIDLKEATPQIVRALKAERGKADAARAVDADREKAVSGTDLSLLAKQRGLVAKMTPMFGSSETFPEITPMEEFKRNAFSLGVKEVGPVLESPNGYFLLRIAQRKEPTLPPLENVRAQVEAKAREAKALELANKKAQALLEQLKKEKDIEKVAKTNGLQVGDTGWFSRSDMEIPKVGALNEAAPRSIALSANRPVPEQIYTQATNVYLFAFKASQGADMDRFEKEKPRLIEQALAEKKQTITRKLIEDLKGKARVKVEPAFLES